MTAHDLIKLRQKLLHPAGLAIEPSALQVCLEGLTFERLAIDAVEGLNIDAKLAERQRGIVQQRSNTVGVVDISGEMVDRTGGMSSSQSGLRSYEGIAEDVDNAALDDRVGNIVLRIDTPGGMVAGIEKASTAIAEARRIKPVVALIDSQATSAGYWLASQADKVVATEGSIVGGIGVIYTHIDTSAKDEKEGIKRTVITFGDRKGAIGEGPLDAEAKGDLQEFVDASGERFVAAVAAGREGTLTADQIRKQEARVFFGADKAIEAGLVDEVGTFQSVVADLLSEQGSEGAQSAAAASHNSQTTEASMSTENPTGAADQAAADAAKQTEEARKIAAAESERVALIAGVCMALGAVDIQESLVKGKITGQNAQGIAQAYAIAAHGADEDLVAKLQGLITPGVTAQDYALSVTSLRNALDAKLETNGAIVGHEGTGEKKTKYTLEACQAYAEQKDPKFKVEPGVLRGIAELKSLRVRG